MRAERNGGPWAYADSYGPDQTALERSLIWAVAVRLESKEGTQGTSPGVIVAAQGIPLGTGVETGPGLLCLSRCCASDCLSCVI